MAEAEGKGAARRMRIGRGGTPLSWLVVVWPRLKGKKGEGRE